MERFTVESAGSKTLLVYQIDVNNRDTVTQGMITNNRIPGFLPAFFFQADTQQFVKYDITSRIPVQQILAGTVKSKQLLGIFKGITEAMACAEDYMIPLSNLVLDTQYIFADVSTFDAQMICLPVMSSQDAQPDYLNFFKEILYKSRYADNEDNTYVAKLISYLNGLVSFSASDFSEFLKSMDNDVPPVKVVPVKQVQQVQSTVQYHAPQPQPVQPQPQPVQAQPQPVQPQPVQPKPIQPKPQPQTPVRQPMPTAPQQNSGMRIPAPTPNVQAGNQANNAPRMPQAPNGMNIPQNNPAGNYGMNVPQGRTPGMQPQAAAATPAPQDGEEEMSWLYLMQHYNKENAALYKAQQARKKAEKAGGASQKPAKPQKEKKQKGAAPAQTDFRVPGAPAGAQPGYQQPQAQGPASRLQVQPQQPVRPQVQPQQPAGYTPQPAQASAFTPQPAQPMMQTPPQGGGFGYANFGETTVLNSLMDDHTMVIGAGEMPATEKRPYLIRLRTNERVPVSGPIFRIGKERSYVDYFIGDNAAISRTHAAIETRDGRYFITDSNSTNHTFVEGQMIPGSTPTEIKSGTKLKLADEDFEFVIQ